MPENVTVAVTILPKQSEAQAGGPIELDLRVTNRTPATIFYLIGNARGRPAFLKFSAELQPDGGRFRDPYPEAPLEPDGPFASIPVEEGKTDIRTIVLNQYVALEDSRDRITPGASALLRVHWECFIAASRKPKPYLPKAEPVAGEFQVKLLRDDVRLLESVQALADQLTSDSSAVPRDAVGRRDAITALASLRIPEAAPYLNRLIEFPDFEVRSMARHALSELKIEPK